MGKDGEHSEFNMEGQSTQIQKLGGWRSDEGARGLDGGAMGDKDYNKLLKSKIK